MTEPAMSMTMRDAALELAAAGYSVFPLYSVVGGKCTCGKDSCDIKRMGKHPRTTSGFKDAVTGELPAGWWAGRVPENVGVATGGGLLVVDIDTAGVENWETMVEVGPTVCSRTGSGGYHWWYRLPAGRAFQCSVSKLARGIDVRCEGGYVVAPPSVHGTGVVYTWEDVDAVVSLGELPECPAWLLERLERVETERAADAVGGADNFILGERNTALCRLAGTMRRRNMGEASIRAALFAENNEKCRPPLDEKEVSEIARSVSKYAPGDPVLSEYARSGESKQAGEEWRKGLACFVSGTARPTAGNATLYFCWDRDWKGSVGLDEFGGKVIWLREPPLVEGGGLPVPVTGDELRDGHIVYAQHWLQLKYDIHVSEGGIHTALGEAARVNGFHPVRSWLRGLQWDGVERLPSWLTDHFGVAASAYSREVARAWMVSAVARVMKPGCQVDHMLVLEGKQGKGKTRVMESLFGEAWYLGRMPDLRDKDSMLGLRGKWCIEFGELDAMKGAGATRTKDFLTQRTDEYRPPYGHLPVVQPRQCVFIGTTNEEKWMVDSTGGRRFWPVKVMKIDREKVAEVRDVLWAEAVVRYDRGEKWWPNDADVDMFEAEQEERYDVDAWEDTLSKYSEGRTSVSMESVVTMGLGLEMKDLTRTDQTRIGVSMRRLGWGRVRRRVGGALTTHYVKRGHGWAPEPPAKEVEQGSEWGSGEDD